MTFPQPKDFKVAIVGGGIAGLTLAIALHYRQVPAILYESAAGFAEIGAGVSFTTNALQAMKHIHPGVFEAFERACTVNGWDSKRDVWFDYLDGTADHDREAFTIRTGLGQAGVHRAHYLDELVKLLPADKARFGKRLEDIEVPATPGDAGRLVLRFRDGSSETADAVIGCDGIKSRVRQLLVADDNPAAAHPGYTHKYAYRGLVPMAAAVAAVGDERARNACMHMGPGGHVLTFPVSGGEQLNIVAFRTTEDDWPDRERLARPARREDALRDFAGYGRIVTSLLRLTSEELSVWAIFDTADNPPHTYYKGRVCIAGDAAHATSPHHGSGAGFCVEDSAVLADLLADEHVRTPADLEAVFAAYDAARRERAQWLVRSSRFIGDSYEWRAEGVGKDFAKIEKEINERLSIIGDVDVAGFCRDARADLVKRLESQLKN
ncbi:uncharacterized protein JN550_008948 [Neoarthrinium moseri]|uniref:uncharacterized protein n=1 Tax=Neoarthrinium moseri TaxID=1658444 RepID=UPI001FDE80D6|nr:uncharacterized protein JN550_008948 [Neoarthrinium moseri]KAI1864391.1 hypothetical protein JN550_008948 [Neoarthrinium moseri]